jgi:hypothetical protein
MDSRECKMIIPSTATELVKGINLCHDQHISFKTQVVDTQKLQGKRRQKYKDSYTWIIKKACLE